MSTYSVRNTCTFRSTRTFWSACTVQGTCTFRSTLNLICWGHNDKRGKLCYLLVEAKHKNNPININLLVALKKAVDVGSALVVLHGSFRRDTPTMVQKLNIKGPNSRATFSYSGAER